MVVAQLAAAEAAIVVARMAVGRQALEASTAVVMAQGGCRNLSSRFPWRSRNIRFPRRHRHRHRRSPTQLPGTRCCTQVEETAVAADWVGASKAPAAVMGAREATEEWTATEVVRAAR